MTYDPLVFPYMEHIEPITTTTITNTPSVTSKLSIMDTLVTVATTNISTAYTHFIETTTIPTTLTITETMLFLTTTATTTMMTNIMKSTKNNSNNLHDMLNMANQNSSLDITENDFRRFFEYMQIYQTQHECADYCKGDFYKMLKTYNGIHGYVALMVSTTIYIPVLHTLYEYFF